MQEDEEELFVTTTDIDGRTYSVSVRVDFDAPDDSEIESVGLPADCRRHLLLVFKETVTNIARHARASNVRIRIAVESGKLRMAIADDGRGFDPGADSPGGGAVQGRAEGGIGGIGAAYL